MTLAPNKEEILGLVDVEKGLVERKVFSDRALYELELDNIFGRAWNFMCHESQIARPGDFFSTVIGEDNVICVRDKDGGIQVLLNSCRHRGNAICRSEHGHASSFMCAYHGWTYDLKGNLVGVPGYKEMYHEELDRSQWGLAKAAKVESYRGFVFATMDELAPSLDDFLGEVGHFSIDVLAGKGDLQVVPGIQKYIIPCNWKFATENVWDAYHADVTHISATMVRPGSVRPTMNSYWSVMLGEHGHGQLLAMQDHDLERLATPGVHKEHETWKMRHEASLKMSTPPRNTNHGIVFPNLWVGGSRLALRIPRGPLATEIWWWTLLDPAIGEDKYLDAINVTLHGQGPAGLAEQDDGDNWTLATFGTISPKNRTMPFNYTANMGHGQVIEEELGPPRVSGAPNEHAALWFYRAWTEWLAAESWPEYMSRHSPSPEGFV